MRSQRALAGASYLLKNLCQQTRHGCVPVCPSRTRSNQLVADASQRCPFFGWLLTPSSSASLSTTTPGPAWASLSCKTRQHLAHGSAMSDRRDDDRSSRDRERSRSRDRDRAVEEPPKRRSRFSDAPAAGSGFSEGPPAEAAGFSAAVPLDARAAAMALAQQLSQKFMSGAGAAAGAAPTGFSSGGAGLASLFSGGGGGGFGGGGGGGGPPPGEPLPPPGKLMGTAKRWNMEKGFGASTPTHQLIHPIAPRHSRPATCPSLHAPAVTVAQVSSFRTRAAMICLYMPIPSKTATRSKMAPASATASRSITPRTRTVPRR